MRQLGYLAGSSVTDKAVDDVADGSKLPFYPVAPLNVTGRSIARTEG